MGVGGGRPIPRRAKAKASPTAPSQHLKTPEFTQNGLAGAAVTDLEPD